LWFVIDCLASFQLTTGGAGVLEVENLTDLVSIPAGFQLSAAEEDLFDTVELPDPLSYIKENPHEAMEQLWDLACEMARDHPEDSICANPMYDKLAARDTPGRTRFDAAGDFQVVIDLMLRIQSILLKEPTGIVGLSTEDVGASDGAKSGSHSQVYARPELRITRPRLISVANIPALRALPSQELHYQEPSAGILNKMESAVTCRLLHANMCVQPNDGGCNTHAEEDSRGALYLHGSALAPEMFLLLHNTLRHNEKLRLEVALHTPFIKTLPKANTTGPRGPTKGWGNNYKLCPLCKTEHRPAAGTCRNATCNHDFKAAKAALLKKTNRGPGTAVSVDKKQKVLDGFSQDTPEAWVDKIVEGDEGAFSEEF